MTKAYNTQKSGLKIYKKTDQLPSNITLNDVIKTMPKEVFHKDMFKAWMNVFVTVFFCALSVVLISVSPWWLLPVAWFFAGTAFTGCFVIGHDCGHLSFARSHWLNDAVGITVFLPLMYPFESWRIQHNFHHNNTNKLHVDNAWQPFQADYYSKAPLLERFTMEIVKGPLYWIASVFHQIKTHFFPSQFLPSQQYKVKFSIACVFIFASLFFPYMLANFGVWGLMKYWFVPWLGFHFWMSTFTMVHHTLPFLPFLPEDQWNDAQARLNLTVHCEYPQWIEFLCHHINVHIPHHVSTGIPSYNLRKAHNALKGSWDRYMNETSFGFQLLKDITTNCHLYHEEECYVPFSAEKQVLDDLNKKQAANNKPAGAASSPQEARKGQ